MFLSFLVLCGWWPEAAHLPSSPGGSKRPCGYCMWSGWATGRMRSLSRAANSAVGAGGFSILISRLSGGRELFGCTMGPAGFHERKTLPSPVCHFMETSEQPRQQSPRAARSMAAAARLSATVVSSRAAAGRCCVSSSAGFPHLHSITTCRLFTSSVTLLLSSCLAQP